MRKGREIIGLPVVSLATGKEIGVVDDILWSHQDSRIRYLVVGDHCIPFSDISSIGTDAITVSGVEVLKVKDEDGDLSELRSVNQTGGELVLSEDGENLGTLKDVLFDTDEGKLLGYELSAGVVGDLLSGRMIMSPEMVFSWGKESIIAGISGSNRGDQGAVSDMPR
ncbi:MAG: PRC-barrel domain-containing protein [Syntrophaceticus sp.]